MQHLYNDTRYAVGVGAAGCPLGVALQTSHEHADRVSRANENTCILQHKLFTNHADNAASLLTHVLEYGQNIAIDVSAQILPL